MIQLERHIEVLLLTNECVIVPDFGGFMTHQVPARYDHTDFSFLPPMRTLGFNPQLRLNDSLLVQSYVEAYDISYPEALRQIEAEVAELRQHLSEQGSYTMNDLGTLTVNKEGRYEFTPCEAGILSPEFYGLDSYAFKTLNENAVVEIPVTRHESVKTPQAKEVALQPTLLEFTDNHDDDSAISIKMSWIRNAVAVAAAVIAFFFMATPIANSDLGTPSMSDIQHRLLYKLIPQDTNIVPAAKVEAPVSEASEVTEKSEVSEDADAKENFEDNESGEVSAPAAAPMPATTYCVVVASQVKMSNAEAFVEKLHKQGYTQARIHVTNNIVRVICGEYATPEEAYRMQNKISNNSDYYDAWVLKVKTEA